MIKGIAHLAFMVSDMNRSLSFYKKAFDFDPIFKLHRQDGEPWIVYLKVREDQFIELFHPEYPLNINPKKISYQHLCFEVEDIYEVASRLKENLIPLDVPVILGEDHNYQCWVSDPDGNKIELMQYGKDALQRRQAE